MKIKKVQNSFVGILLLTLTSCTDIDVEKEKKAILDVMTRVEKAHFSKDANEFYAPYGDRWTDVRGGAVSEAVKEAVLPLTQEYLEGMEFDELVQRGEPVIALSDDGTMAGFVGSVVVKGRNRGEPVFWVVAWQSVLRKMDGEWKIISTANTEAGPDGAAAVLFERVQERLGELPDESVIYALANCEGPDRAFRTLVISGNSGARMEQAYGDSHIILAYGEDEFLINAKNGEENDKLDAATRQFIAGHELHQMAYKPKSRHKGHVMDGIEEFNGQAAFKVSAIDNLDNPVSYYFRFDNYQPMGFRITPADNSGDVVVTFHDWEERDQREVFTRAVFTQGDEVFTYRFTEVDFKADADLLDEKEALLD